MNIRYYHFKLLILSELRVIPYLAEDNIYKSLSL